MASIASSFDSWDVDDRIEAKSSLSSGEPLFSASTLVGFIVPRSSRQYAGGDDACDGGIGESMNLKNGACLSLLEMLENQSEQSGADSTSSGSLV